ncbi:kappa-type opioid receptor isoform X1 [Hydra vulgaris]|uniref:kappa-type opioid receptor isoform X1 n=1 Tax=Hydra vulgaris TaxID=6087 RepID=UPI0001924E91|nr:kappa-type opioid receptor [Hydra vulgaris]
MNLTLESNVTLSALHPTEVPQALRFVSFTVCIAVITLGVIGNGLVLMIFGLKWSNLKSWEILLFNLALADFLNSTVVPVKTIFDLLYISLYHIGHNGCKVISFIGLTSMTASALNLLAVSIDQFISIKWLINQRPHICSLLTVTSVWLAAAGLGFFYLIDKNIKLKLHADNVYTCFNSMKQNHYIKFSITAVCIQCFIPILLMTILYSAVILELKKKNGTLNHRLQQNKKVTKMIFTIVLIFYICFLPANIFFMWYLFYGQNHPTQIMKSIYDILALLQMCNSIVNPIIYSILHASFKKDIANAFSLCCNKIHNWSTMQNTTQSMLSRNDSRGERLISNSSFDSRKTRTSSTLF